MATPHRSPSPIANRPTTTFRSPEWREPLRKSCNSNFPSRPSFSKSSRSSNPPPPPVNSPIDFPQRLAGFHRVSNDQKENEKETSLNCSKGIRERSAVAVKGVKSFMAPTISAASKVVPSPKTKVLAERNEEIGGSQVRLDLPFPVSEINPTLSSMNPLELSEEEEAKQEIGTNTDVGFDSELPYGTKNLSDFQSKSRKSDFESKKKLDHGVQACLDLPALVSKAKPTLSSMNPLELAEEEAKQEIGTNPDMGFDSELPNDTKNLSDFHSKSRKSDFKSEEKLDHGVDPLEPDPSLPPYDPKTNYLSPRPQFLRYKPNPRIELYLNKEKVLDIGGEGKNLEESFTSESSLDTELIGEAESSPEQQKNSRDELSSVEDGASEGLDLHVSEGEIEEELMVKTRPKSHSFPRLRIRHLVLFLLIACLSALTLTDSPFELSLSEYRDLSIAKLHDPALEAFSGLERRYRSLREGKYPILSEPLMKIMEIANRNLMPYVPKMFPILKDEETGSFMSSFRLNSTVSGRDYSEQEQLQDVNQSVAVGYKESNEIEEEMIEIKAEEMIENKVKGEDGIGEVEETVAEEERNLEKKTEEENNDNNILELSLNCNIEETATQEEQTNFELNYEENVESPLILHDPEMDDSEMTIEALLSLPELSSATTEKTEIDTDIKDLQVHTATASIIHEIGDEFFIQNVIGISSILLTLAGTMAFLYFKKKGTTVRNVATEKPPLSPKKMMDDSLSASGESYSHFQNLASKFAVEEMVGESHPAEMSSTSEKSFSSDWRSKLAEEGKIQSHERRVKRNSNRDSMISSDYSVESPSFGSFTTLELLLSKQGCGDGEKVTPVRRSSRIRKQVLSP